MVVSAFYDSGMLVMFFISMELESWISLILSDLFLALFQKSSQQVLDFGIFFALKDSLYFSRQSLMHRSLKEFLESKSLTIRRYLVVMNSQKPYYLQERLTIMPFCMMYASMRFQSSIYSNQQLSNKGCYVFFAYLLSNLFKSSQSFTIALLWQLKKNCAYFSLISNRYLLFFELSSLLASQMVLLLMPKQLSMGNSLKALSLSLSVISPMNCLIFFDSASFSMQAFLSACRKALVQVISAILVEKVLSLRWKVLICLYTLLLN